MPQLLRGNAWGLLDSEVPFLGMSSASLRNRRSADVWEMDLPWHKGSRTCMGSDSSQCAWDMGEKEQTGLFCPDTCQCPNGMSGHLRLQIRLEQTSAED